LRQLLIVSLLAIYLGYGCSTKQFSNFKELEITINQPKIGEAPVTFLIIPGDLFYCTYHTLNGDATYRYLWSNRTKAWEDNNQNALIDNFNEINFIQLDAFYHDNSLKDSSGNLNCVISYKKDSIVKHITINNDNKISQQAIPKNISEFIYRLLVAANSKDRNLIDTTINFKTWTIENQ
jgi:hypothetical protein